MLRPLSDVDVAVYLDDAVDPVRTRVDLIGVVTKHLGTDELDLVVLNRAPTALLGRILQSRKVIVDKEPFLRHRFESLAPHVPGLPDLRAEVPRRPLCSWLTAICCAGSSRSFRNTLARSPNTKR